MNINIVYEINNREFDNSVLIQRELIRRGHKVNILNKSEDVVYSNKDTVTIVPNSYRNGDVEYYRYVFNTKNNPLIVFPCEQVTNHKLPLYFDYSSTNKAKRLPHLCWGEDYQTFIEELGFLAGNNYIVGAPQLDFCRKEFSSLFHNKQELADKYDLPIDKKWILFISDFVFASKTLVNQIKREGDQESHTLDAKHELENKTLDVLLKWFVKFVENNEDYIIIYRKHPVEQLTEKVLDIAKEQKGKIFLVSELNIKEWIINCDQIGCWYSTAAVECYFADKNISLLRPFDFTKDSKMVDYSFFNGYPKIRNYAEFENVMLSDIGKITETSEREITKLYCHDTKPSYVKIADAIEKISTEWNTYELERNYYRNRWRYLIKNKIIIKSIVKKFYQKMFIFFGVNLAKKGEMNYAVLEWNASALNKKKYRDFSRKIDEIIKNNRWE